MQPTHKQIATEFSGGNFEFTYPYLAADVSFNIVGEQLITGKGKLIEFCTGTAKYFTEVTTKFNLDNLIVDDECVAINGTAEFYLEKEGRTSYISSCDVYKFKDGMLQAITSYCISTKKEER
ncbi:MAG: nuclear transport factor 2 family protein [Bacteroidota bacterium]|nr:nuclear transport factor 2 family protein [Bacteroidota bacterium]